MDKEAILKQFRQFSRRLERWVDRLLEQRYFPMVFWSVLLVFFSILLWWLMATKTVDNIETTLLDIRLRHRAESQTPDPDIVILAADRATQTYIRNHPEMNIPSITLPRQRVTQMIDYLHAQGARAIILDNEFVYPGEGDQDLAQAIRRAGNVYSAAMMDTSLREVALNTNMDKLSELVLYQEILVPYIQSSVRFRQRFLHQPYTGPLSLGLVPYFPIRLQIIQPSTLSNLIRYSNLQPYLSRNFQPDSWLSARLSMPQNRTQSPNNRFLARQCMKSAYLFFQSRNPGYLSWLEKQKLPVRLKQSLPPDVDQQITQCYMGPIVDEIAHGLKGLGIVSVSYDEDAYIREIPMLLRGYEGNFYTYLGIRPALDLMGVSQLEYQPRQVMLRGEQGLVKSIPFYQNASILINWKNPARGVIAEYTRANVSFYEANLLAQVKPNRSNRLLNGGHLYRIISAIDVLLKSEGKRTEKSSLTKLYGRPNSGEFNFKNKVVVYGNTIKDIHRTPMGRTTYGPEVVAAAIDMMLHDTQFIVPAPQWAVITVTTLISLAILASTLLSSSLSFGFGASLLLLVFYWAFDFAVFGNSPLPNAYVFPLVIPSFFMICALAIGTLYRYYIHDRESHQITQAFSNLVSPQIMDLIISDPAHALDNLKGGKKELTVLFSDIHGFTKQFENVDPIVMVSQLNEYFDVMTEIILKNGGTYDKYMGDAIMAFFGAPAHLPNHAQMACAAALEMHMGLRYLNANWIRQGLQPIHHGIGIASGEMFVGSFGSRRIKNFTVMGSNVNLGSRLEAYTRVAGMPIIIKVHPVSF